MPNNSPPKSFREKQARAIEQERIRTRGVAKTISNQQQISQQQSPTIFEEQKSVYNYYRQAGYSERVSESYKDLYFAEKKLEELKSSKANYQKIYEKEKEINAIKQDISRATRARDPGSPKIPVQKNYSFIEGSPVVGGYSSVTGESVFITPKGSFTQVPASFAGNQFSSEPFPFSPNFNPSETLTTDYITGNAETARFTKFSTKQNTKENFTPAPDTEKKSDMKQQFSENTGLTPFGQWLIKEKGISTTIGNIEREFSYKLNETIKKSEEKTGYKNIFARQIKGAGERTVFPTLKFFSDPIENFPKASSSIESFGRNLFDIKYIGVAGSTANYSYEKNKVPQIVTNKKFVSEIRENILKDYSENPTEFSSGLISGFSFDTKILIPTANFLGRPVTNVISTSKNFIRGVEVGVVEGTTNYNIIRKGSKTFLLEPDIHAKLSSIPEIGDKSLVKLLKQTNAGSGENITGLTFVGGALTTAEKGDDFLLRQITTHWKGVKEAPLYASPEATLSTPLSVISNRGENLFLEPGSKIYVGSKQFASGLSETGYEGMELSLTKQKNLGVLVREPVERVKFSKNLLDYRREFFDPKYSAKSTIQFSNEFLASKERQIGYQSQGVRFYKSRGTRLKFLDDETIKADIFNKKMIPFGIGEKNPVLQSMYEDIGFGREYLPVEFKFGELRVPVGRPPSKDFNGKPVYIRPASRAVVEQEGKLLFVQEGKGKLIFPGGGVDPILVPGQGKEGVRLAYPNVRDYGQTALRELSEETGGVGFSAKKINIVINSEISNFRPPVRGKTVFRFQDVNRFYKVGALPFFRPSGEITKIYRLSPKEALLSPSVGGVEKEFIRRYYFKQKPSSNVKSSLRSSEIKKISEEYGDSYDYSPKRKQITPFDYIDFSKRKFYGYNQKYSSVKKEGFTSSYFVYPINSNRSSPGYSVSVSRGSGFYSKSISRSNISSGFSSREISSSYKPTPYYPKSSSISSNVSYPSSRYYRSSSIRKGSGTSYPPYRPPSPPRTPPSKSFSKPSFPSLKNLFSPSFGVVTKFRGKERLVKSQLTLSDAQAYGARLVNQSLRASFRLVPTGGLTRSKGISYENIPLYRSKRDPRFLVEPRSRRLSTRGEITEIQASKRLRRLL